MTSISTFLERKRTFPSFSALNLINLLRPALESPADLPHALCTNNKQKYSTFERDALSSVHNVSQLSAKEEALFKYHLKLQHMGTFPIDAILNPLYIYIDIFVYTGILI